MSALRSALHRALLVGAPFAALEVGCGWSSCPDDGNKPLVATLKAIEPAYAAGAPLTAAQCLEVCVEDYAFQPTVVTCVRDTPGTVLCFVPPYPCEGRRPVGLKPAKRRATDSPGDYLAEVAWLEAASITAFRLLRRELRAHGAPRALEDAALRAARDECHHARVATALARRYGGTPPEVKVGRTAVRPLEALALENAVEGCVRETWGALVSVRQAERAIDPKVRAAMARIATDEVRHAELAFAVDAWARSRLGTAAQRGVSRARRGAVAQLLREEHGALAPAARAALGLPGPTEARAMLCELKRSLWS